MVDFNRNLESNEFQSNILKELKLVDAHYLAEILSVSTRTVWRMRSAGELPSAVCLRGSTRWRLSDIEDWIESGCAIR